MVLAGIALLLISYFSPTSAGIKIETTPTASVFLNGEQVGRTPFNDSRAAGEVVVRLVPDAGDQALSPYETKLDLVEGIETAILYEFGQFAEESSGTIVSFEKESGNQTALSVITQPDSAQISLDGSIVGFAPFKTTSVSEGAHVVEVSHPGYKSRNVSIQTRKGYNLTVSFTLAVNPDEEVPEPSPTPTPEEEVEIVIIQATPTGFLRVRSGPATTEVEVGQVEPGEEFALLEESDDGEWYKIEYEEEEEGWISSQYAKIKEES